MVVVVLIATSVHVIRMCSQVHNKVVGPSQLISSQTCPSVCRHWAQPLGR